MRDHTAVVLEAPQHVVLDRRDLAVDLCVVDRAAERLRGASGCGGGLVAVELARHQSGQRQGMPSHRGQPDA